MNIKAKDIKRLGVTWEKVRTELNMKETLLDLLAVAKPGLRAAIANVATGGDLYTAFRGALEAPQQRALDRVRALLIEAHGQEYVDDLFQRMSQ